MLKYKAILFDLGSTLIEYENHDWATLGRMGIMAAHPFLKTRFPSLPDVYEFGPMFYQYLREILDARHNHSEVGLYDTCYKIFRKMKLDTGDGLIEKFVDIYYQPVRDQITMVPQAVTILDTISKSGMTIGLVSNSIFPEKFHIQEMKQLGLHKYFDFTIFSSSVGTRKPGKRIFEIALNKAGVHSEEAIFVGDRFDADIAGAINAGIVSVWKYKEGRENPDGVQPDYIIRNLNELVTIVIK